jgi:hypothetical protein
MLLKNIVGFARETVVRNEAFQAAQGESIRYSDRLVDSHVGSTLGSNSCGRDLDK